MKNKNTQRQTVLSQMLFEAPDENEWTRINLHQSLQGSVHCNKSVLLYLLNVNF